MCKECSGNWFFFFVGSCLSNTLFIRHYILNALFSDRLHHGFRSCRRGSHVPLLIILAQHTEWFAMLKIIVRMGVTLLWIYCPSRKMRPIFLVALIARHTPTSKSCRLGRCRVWRKPWLQEHRSLQDTIPAATVSSKPFTYLTEKIHIHSHNRHPTKLA